MRLSLIATLALAAAAAPLPALAQDADNDPLAGAVERMDDPVVQEQAGLMAAMLVGALMEMRVGPLAEAMAEMTGGEGPAVDPDARVADLLGPDAADAPVRVAEQVPQMMGAMAAMAGAFGDMLPQMRAMGERMRRELPETDR
ncbi:hypothetical protein GRI62_12050 [Erythrobacter arachoides]|uniref:Uncharacterized protein n=1 Tax=Aurantiacibacter arachoides TaxID=1850444 RepID=A0A845A320_9SPHN|nr:hypothetical protein [Aurantiacibacter arachoides]MXO94328.1 hypothetical protein [Aurantiacibacter arachoides]GGD64335.1 hypothetical protein GCM10011411_25800 [Aurantiacibacter arachoides]